MPCSARKSSDRTGRSGPCRCLGPVRSGGLARGRQAPCALRLRVHGARCRGADLGPSHPRPSVEREPHGMKLSSGGREVPSSSQHDDGLGRRDGRLLSLLSEVERRAEHPSVSGVLADRSPLEEGSGAVRGAPCPQGRSLFEYDYLECCSTSMVQRSAGARDSLASALTGWSRVARPGPRTRPRRLEASAQAAPAREERPVRHPAAAAGWRGLLSQARLGAGVVDPRGRVAGGPRRPRGRLIQAPQAAHDVGASLFGHRRRHHRRAPSPARTRQRRSRSSRSALTASANDTEPARPPARSMTSSTVGIAASSMRR